LRDQNNVKTFANSKARNYILSVSKTDDLFWSVLLSPFEIVMGDPDGSWWSRGFNSSALYVTGDNMRGLMFL